MLFRSDLPTMTRPLLAWRTAATIALIAPLIAVSSLAAAKDITLLNVSYDPTRELYQDVNAAFTKQYQAKTGDTVEIQEGRPISKTKAWTLTKVVQVAQVL